MTSSAPKTPVSSRRAQPPPGSPVPSSTGEGWGQHPAGGGPTARPTRLGRAWARGSQAAEGSVRPATGFASAPRPRQRRGQPWRAAETGAEPSSRRLVSPGKRQAPGRASPPGGMPQPLPASSGPPPVSPAPAPPYLLVRCGDLWS